MSVKPLVSVIMNCFNSDRFLREAIQSVMDQTCSDWEIIFWDNQSTDASAEIVRSFADSRIKYFYAPVHTRLGEARNCALEKCTGEFITFLDCDDVWFPAKLEKQVEIMRNLPAVDFVYANYYEFDIEGGTKKLYQTGAQPEGDVFERFLYNYTIGYLTVMIRRCALARVSSLFDPALRLVEEYDLFMRILATSQAAYISEPVAFYRVHRDMNSLVLRDAWPEEYSYVLGKLRQLDPERKYTAAFEYLERRVAYLQAIIDMAKGNLKEAREKLAPHKCTRVKYFLAYLATFMPVRLWLFLRPVWGRGVYTR